MANAWDVAAEMADKYASTGGMFVKLQDGDKIVGAFCGEPKMRRVVWTGSGYEDFDPGNPNHNDLRPGIRAKLNFYVPSEASMKIIEGGGVWFETLLKVRAKYGLENWLFEVERHGTGTDTKYTIMPEEKISDELKKEIAQTDLLELDSGKSSGRAPAERKPRPSFDDNDGF